MMYSALFAGKPVLRDTTLAVITPALMAFARQLSTGAPVYVSAARMPGG